MQKRRQAKATYVVGNPGSSNVGKTALMITRASYTSAPMAHY